MKKGFSLIELMVVLAVLAILAGIGYPLYNAQIQKARRYDAQGLLMIAADELERLRGLQPNAGYVGFSLGAMEDLWDPPSTSSPFLAHGYTFAVQPATLSFSFEVTATLNESCPEAENVDRCVEMFVDHLGQTGARNCSDELVENCWK